MMSQPPTAAGTEREQEIRARLDAAMPGPWMWFGNLATHTVYLATTHSGRRYVMGFKRWGMRNSQPVFQVDSSMHDLDELVGTGHVEIKYDKEILALQHPDAAIIAHAPADLDYLLGAVSRLREHNAQLEIERDKARDAAHASRRLWLANNTELLRLLAESRAALQSAQDALKTYGDHSLCALTDGYGDPCNCGWSAWQKKLHGSPGAVSPAAPDESGDTK